VVAWRDASEEFLVSLWIVSNIPPLLLLFGLVVVIAGGAVLIQRFARRRFTQLTQDAHNDVTKFAYGVIGFVYAFFIGFVVSAMWGQIGNADAKVRLEGAAGVQLAKDMSVFEKGDRDRLRQSLLDYENAALIEWPLSASGKSYPEADNALRRLYTSYTQVKPQNAAQTTFLGTSFSNLDKVSQARTERVLQARTDIGPPWSLWVVIFVTTGMVLGCAIIYGVENPRIHYPMVATIGMLVAVNLFLVLELAHPFVGEMATSPEPLRQAVHVLTGQ
jgi:Protein of unknown function (DUF4239)